MKNCWRNSISVLPHWGVHRSCDSAMSASFRERVVAWPRSPSTQIWQRVPLKPWVDRTGLHLEGLEESALQKVLKRPLCHLQGVATVVVLC